MMAILVIQIMAIDSDGPREVFICDNGYDDGNDDGNNDGNDDGEGN